MTLCGISTLLRWNADRSLGWGLRCVAVITASIVVLIVALLLGESAAAIRSVAGRLLTDPTWHPQERAAGGTFGMMPMVWGTLTVAVGGCVIAAPVALASAVFCRFYAQRGVALTYRRLLELLAGIPSVVYGFWGLVVLAPLVARVHPPGPSLLTGILILALMILPTIALVADAALAGVPSSYIHGAVALGLGRWTIVRTIAVPVAWNGLVTAVVLGAARAVGETMAVLMVCGNIVKVPRGLFDPVRTLTANIALEMGYALGDHRSALFASGLMLMLIVSLLIGLVELFKRSRCFVAAP